MTFKQKILAVASVAAPALSFAEPGEQSAFQTALGNIQTGMTETISAIVPVVATVVVAAIALWAIPFAWRKLRGGAGR